VGRHGPVLRDRVGEERLAQEDENSSKTLDIRRASW
jgi:hypothetical protein